MAMTDPHPESSELALVLTRVFDAPRGLVFKSWTEPQHIARWWGPEGFNSQVLEMDVRPGGSIRIHMHAPDGSLYPVNGTFHEILFPERLVFSMRTLEDEHGNPQLDVLHIVTFAELDGKTRLTLQVRTIKSTPEAAPLLSGMEQGWTEALERLAASLLALI